MTLEDFFTLTEMKDGLTSHSRVEEMISVMQKDKDSVMRNITEVARQWSTVASTLAATENRDSLDHFVSLDGLVFLERWLQEAQKFTDDTCDNSVEESISLLLGALKKLPIDNKRSVSSGIGATVKKLFVHKSSGVQEKARALFDGWNQGMDNGKDHQDMEEKGGFLDDRVKQVDATVAAESGCPEDSSLDKFFIERTTDGKPLETENKHLRSSDGSHPEGIRDVKNSITSNKDSNRSILNQRGEEDEFRDNAQGLLFMSSSCQRNIPIMEDTTRYPPENIASTGICEVPASVEWKASDIPKLKDSTIDAKEMNGRNGSLDQIGEKETSPVFASPGHNSVSSADPADVRKPVMQHDLLGNTDAKQTEVFIGNTPPAAVEGKCTVATELNPVVVESETQKHLTSVELEGTDQVGGSYSDDLPNSNSEGCILRKPDILEASFCGKQDIDTVDSMEELAGESILKVEEDNETNIGVSKSEVVAKASDTNRSSDMEFDYGVDDALEVARLVAKEVEREVVDYREQFCSSSEKNSEGIVQPGSPDSINGEGDGSVGSQNKSPVRQNLPCRAFSPEREDHLMNAEYVAKTVDCVHEVDSFHATEALQNPADESKKGLCDIDLNEVCSEEMDQPTVTFVSASKVAPAGVPRAPLHFEGELGWKGSAATSAFRPTSAHRTPDGEKPLSVDGSSQSSKQRQGFLDIDLNVADGYGDGATHPALGKQLPVSSDLPSGESSIEVSSRRAQRLKLDLNLAGDNEETPSLDCRMEERFRYHHRNGSPSPASSSSSRQFPMRNIDLNGNPSFFDDSSDLRPGFSKCSSIDMNTSGGFKRDVPVVSILGARVAINRPELVPPTRSFLPNGRGVESPMGAVFTRSENGLGAHHPLAYAPPPPSLFGYNGFSMGTSVSLSPAMYGPTSVPCMVDSRGSPMGPQMMPSSSDAPPSQPPFLVSMNGPFMGLNGVSRPSFDLNSGLTMVDSESRETGGLRQLFIPVPGLLMEEQMRSSPHPMGPGVGAKRKEPDGGWDVYPVGYKHQPPWH